MKPRRRDEEWTHGHAPVIIAAGKDIHTMEELDFRCPSCGEVNTLQIEWDYTGDPVQDCWVCCHPIHLTVWRDEWGDAQVSAEREGG